MDTPICYIVVPCYNEEAVLPTSAQAFTQKIQTLVTQNKIAPHSKVLFVDDGSTDHTWNIISSLHQENPFITGLKLAHNAGHQNALLAGLMTARQNADVVASFDADLQDDINVLDQFIEKYKQGSQIVFGVRSSRDTDSFFKKQSAQWFYKLMSAIGIQLVYNHADCRLMSRQALEALADFQETNLFLRGIIAQLGFKTDTAYYARTKRAAGKGKYPLKKMLLFAWEGLTSFSMFPIRLITLLGLVMSALSLVVFCYFLIGKLFGSPIPGYASLICSIWLLGGLQLFAISIVGEYIGKTYIETKRRPRYIIETNLN